MTECEFIEPDTLLVNRRYRAPREAVWEAWTQPEALKRWFGTPGFVLEAVEIDLRVGGTYRLDFRTPENEKVTVQGEYREVLEPAKLIYTWNVTGAGRGLHNTLVTVSIIEHGDETEVVVRHEGLTTEDVIAGHRRGWTGNLDQLADEIEGRQAHAD